MRRIKVVKPAERTSPPSGQTYGMTREEAISADGLWVGVVNTEPGMVSGWHHHGDNDTYIHIRAGVLRLEFGPDGADIAEGGPDDFILIPRNTIHRESNPTDEPSVASIFRTGTGPVLFNVEGPA